MEFIFKDRRFWPLFWTQFLGAMNDNFFKNAVVMLITYKSIEMMGLSSASLVAMAGGVFIFPFFLFSATAGQIADRYEKADIIRYTKISELIIMAIAGLGFYLDSYALLMVVLFFMGAQSAFFGPLKYGIIPNLLKEDEIVTGNAYIGGGTFLAILIGTIFGGLATTVEWANQVIGIGVIFVAFIGILTSKKVINVNNATPDIKVDYTFIKPTIDIMRLTKNNKNVFYAVLGISWFWFLGAAILSVLPALVKDVFSGDQTVGTVFLATFTVGMGLGSFICNKLSNKRVEVGMVPLAAVGMTIFLLDLFYVGHTWTMKSEVLVGVSEFLKIDNAFRAFMDLFIISIFGGMFIIPQFAFIQTRAGEHEVSRIIAGNNIWNTIFMVVAAVLIMVMNGAGISIPKILGIFALINLGFSFFLYFKAYTEETLRFIGQVLSYLFYDLEIEGKHNIPKNGGAIIACNHVSYVDWLLVMAVAPRPVRFVIDHIYYNKPGMSFWYDQARLIPIATRKESEETLNRAFDRIAANLESGQCLGIFPEGYLTKNGKMRSFQPGISRIVKKTPAPVIPMAIDGLWGSFFSHSNRGPLKGLPTFKRRKVKITIGAPIAPENLDLKDLELKIHAHLSIQNTDFIMVEGEQ